MRTRSLITLVVVAALVALTAAVILGGSDGPVWSWFESLHGRPGGGH